MSKLEFSHSREWVERGSDGSAGPPLCWLLSLRTEGGASETRTLALGHLPVRPCSASGPAPPQHALLPECPAACRQAGDVLDATQV